MLNEASARRQFTQKGSYMYLIRSPIGEARTMATGIVQKANPKKKKKKKKKKSCSFAVEILSL